MGTATIATLTIESTVERCSETRENLRNAEDALDDEVTELTELQEHKGNLENQIADLRTRIGLTEGELTRRCRLNVRDVPLPLANAEGAGGGRGDVIGDIIAPFPCWPILVQNIEREGIAVDLVPVAEAGLGAGVPGGIGQDLPDRRCFQLQNELEQGHRLLDRLLLEMRVAEEQLVAGDDQIDELQLTLTPKIIGGDYNWVPAKIEDLPTKLAKTDAWLLKGNEAIGGNEVLLKYLRNHS